MAIPYDNWQFWVVTVVALAGLALVIRPLIGVTRSKRRRSSTAGAPGGGGGGASCSSCPSSGASLFRKSNKTTLTVHGSENKP